MSADRACAESGTGSRAVLGAVMGRRRETGDGLPHRQRVSLRERKQHGCPLRVPEARKGAIAEAYLEDRSWPQADPLAGDVQ